MAVKKEIEKLDLGKLMDVAGEYGMGTVYVIIVKKLNEVITEVKKLRL